MKKSFHSIFLTLLLAVSASALEKSDQAHIKLPWDILQGVLKLDNKEVRLTWEEFQILLKHTAPQKLPSFAMKGSDVVMTREEFNRLVTSLIPPSTQGTTTAITKASYRGALKKDSLSLRATLRVDIRFPGGKPAPIDLFPGYHAFTEILLDGRPALTTIENEIGRAHV